MATRLALRQFTPFAGSQVHRAYSTPLSTTVASRGLCKRKLQLQTVSMARTESQQSEIGTPAPDFKVHDGLTAYS